MGRANPSVPEPGLLERSHVHPHRTAPPRRAHRPLAIATTLAALTAGLPASSASALSASLAFASGAEKTGSTATYAFECHLGEGSEWSADWILHGMEENMTYTGGEVQELTVQSATVGTGTFSVDYTGLPAGGYVLTLQCWNNGVHTTYTGAHYVVEGV